MTTSDEYRQFRFTLPPGATEFLLVRHGESAPAREDRPFPLVDGRGDPPLAPDGERQAELVADRLAAEPIDAVYVTSLRRTHQTAAPYVARAGLTPTVEPGLAEIRLGEWEGGLFRIRVAQRHPLAMRMFEQRDWDSVPGGERTAEFGTRVRTAIEKLASNHPDQRVAVFTHGGVVGQLIALATGAASLAFADADNGSISQLVVLGDRWFVRTFNDTAHLHPRFSASAEPLGG